MIEKPDSMRREGAPRYFQMRCVASPVGHWSHGGYDEVSSPDQVEPGLYRHFKGGLYDVLGVARQHDKHGEFVVYRARQDGSLYFRGVHEFLSPVLVDGQLQPRFARQSQEEPMFRYPDDLDKACEFLFTYGNVGRTPADLLNTEPTQLQLRELRRTIEQHVDSAIRTVLDHFAGVRAGIRLDKYVGDESEPRQTDVVSDPVTLGERIESWLRQGREYRVEVHRQGQEVAS